VLAAQQGTGLTDGGDSQPRGVSAGKTGARAGSQRCMNTQQTSPTAPCRSPGPPLDVIAWRVCRLREAGFSAALADTLARQRIDLHALLQLVDRGCPPDLAAHILSPLDDPRVPR